MTEVVHIPDLSEISRTLWDEHKSVAKAANALHDMALADDELYRTLTESYLRAACNGAIQRIVNAQKQAYKPVRIDTVRDVPALSAPARGRPRVYGIDLATDILTMSIGGRQLGILTKQDIYAHITTRTKTLSTELTTHAWLRRIAEGMEDGKTVRETYDEETLTNMKANTVAREEDALNLLPVFAPEAIAAE